MPKSVVTGAAGFIGSNLVRRLLEEGHEVVAIDNLSNGFPGNLADLRGECAFIEGDIRDRALLLDLFKGAEYIFHQAALGSVPRSIDDPWTSHDNNVNGTLNVLLAARDTGVRRVLYAASSSAYGETEVLPKVESMPSTPLSPYAVTKYTGELYVNVLHRVFGLEALALRYFNVFGPRQNPSSQYAAVIPRFVLAMLRGESPIIYGDGEQTRDFTYVENVLSANLAAAQAPADRVAGQVFNIGAGGQTSLNQVIQYLREITGVDVTPIYKEPRPGDVRDSLAGTEKARQAFGYEPSVAIREGLRRTVAWYRER